MTNPIPGDWPSQHAESFNELLNRYNRLLEALHFIRDYQGDPRNPVYTLQTVRARAGAVIEQETLPKGANPR